MLRKVTRSRFDTTGGSILARNAYDLGGAPLVFNHNMADVANTAARLSSTLANGGKGAFVYQQDTGNLFYSSNGSFSGGGTLLGSITTNGATPWVFNSNSFAQVPETTTCPCICGCSPQI